jgi:hypothetical protein
MKILGNAHGLGSNVGHLSNGGRHFIRSGSRAWGEDGQVLVVALILFLSTLRGGRISEQWTSIAVVLWWPLEYLRQYSLYLISGLTLVSVGIQLKNLAFGRPFSISWAVLGLIAFSMYEYTRQYMFEMSTFTSLVLSLGAFSVLLFSWGVVFPTSVTMATDRIMKTLNFGFILFAIASLIELKANRDNVFWNGRFNGVTSHPVFCGVISSLGVCAGLHLLLAGSVKKITRWSSIFCVLVGIAFVIMSGTRTAIVVLSISLLGVLYQHLRGSRLVLALVAACLVLGSVKVTLFYLRESENISEMRITSAENTRVDAWQRLWAVFTEYPMLGLPGQGGESSYLRILASGGVLGGLPFGFGIIFFSVSLVQIFISRGISRESGSIVGLGVSLLVLGIFEGYMLDQITFSLLALLMTMSSVTSIRLWQRGSPKILISYGPTT